MEAHSGRPVGRCPCCRCTCCRSVTSTQRSCSRARAAVTTARSLTPHLFAGYPCLDEHHRMLSKNLDERIIIPRVVAAEECLRRGDARVCLADARDSAGEGSRGPTRCGPGRCRIGAVNGNV